MRDFSSSHEWLSINTATVRKQWRLDRIIDECAKRGIRAIAPWRDQVAAVGLDTIARQLRDTGTVLSGYCRGGFFPAADAARPGRGTGRQPPRRRRSLHPGRALPGAGGGLAARRAAGPAGLPRHRPRAPRSADGIAPRWSTHAGGHAAGHRAAAPHAGRRTRLHQHAGAGAGPVRLLDPRAAARWAWRWTCTTCGGTPSWPSRSRAPAASGCWPITSAIGSPPRATC
jgi:hypothetical protein